MNSHSEWQKKSVFGAHNRAQEVLPAIGTQAKHLRQRLCKTSHWKPVGRPRSLGRKAASRQPSSCTTTRPPHTAARKKATQLAVANRRTPRVLFSGSTLQALPLRLPSSHVPGKPIMTSRFARQHPRTRHSLAGTGRGKPI